MGQIGFNQKINRKKQALCKIKKNIKKLLTFTLPLFVTAILFYIIFSLPQKKAWIYYSAEPRKIEMNNFEGRIGFNTNDITLYGYEGYICNSVDINLDINGEKVFLKAGELQIYFTKKVDTDGVSYWNSINFNQLAKVDIVDEKINLIDSSLSNFIPPMDEDESQKIYNLKMKDVLDFSVVTGKSTSATLHGGYKVFIKKELKDISILNIYAATDIMPVVFEFSNVVQPTFTVFENENNKFYLQGEIDSFNSLSNDTGKLKFTETSDTKNFDVDNIEVTGFALNKKLSASIGYDKNNKAVEILGTVKEINISENSVFLTFDQWLKNNISEVAMTILALFIGTLVVRKEL